MSIGSPPWRYPRWIAHRGAGRLAPENTIAAFALGHAHGFRMFECDVRLSADGRAFVLHDDRLERTTSGRGEALGLDWAALSQLDAGAWHSPAHAGERLPTLAAVVDFCRQRACALNVELKPAPGDERRTGQVVAQELARTWCWSPRPLLSSFSVPALEAAARAAPELPRALLLERFEGDWLATAQRLGCVAVIGERAVWTAAHVACARGAGLRLLAYTVNADEDAQRLLALGLDGLITDRVDHFTPDELPA